MMNAGANVGSSALLATGAKVTTGQELLTGRLLQLLNNVLRLSPMRQAVGWFAYGILLAILTRRSTRWWKR